ncbi:DUF397 domain-containing protein [Actinocatenispora rupis]|uniref:Toxin n=1 Tax=Actinocatenispora rupis TaxID=519421 RepID=A0A8J3NC90_9ACTN|nr:toxin [Actinocatenispora rupis]
MGTVDVNGLRWWKSSRSGGEGGNCVEVATTWRKSTHSGGEGGQCVEVATGWRKSSRSDSQGGECVEVADVNDVWFVRDSKDPDGGVLRVSGTAWRTFLTTVTADA